MRAYCHDWEAGIGCSQGAAFQNLVRPFSFRLYCNHFSPIVTRLLSPSLGGGGSKEKRRAPSSAHQSAGKSLELNSQSASFSRTVIGGPLSTMPASGGTAFEEDWNGPIALVYEPIKICVSDLRVTHSPLVSFQTSGEWGRMLTAHT